MSQVQCHTKQTMVGKSALDTHKVSHSFCEHEVQNNSSDFQIVSEHDQ